MDKPSTLSIKIIQKVDIGSKPQTCDARINAQLAALEVPRHVTRILLIVLIKENDRNLRMQNDTRIQKKRVPAVAKSSIDDMPPIYH